MKRLPKLLIVGIALIALAMVVRRNAPAPVAQLRTPTAAERQAAQTSISRQLEAFRKDDYKQAAIYQSAALQENFRSTAEFRAMMKAHYPRFTDFADVTFGPARSTPDGKRITVLVSLLGRDGNMVDAAYHLVLEQGTYKVAGVEGGAGPYSEPGGAGPSPRRVI